MSLERWMRRIHKWLVAQAFSMCMFFMFFSYHAYSDCEIGACFGVGAELASIDSNDGPLLNTLTQLLLQSDTSVNVGNWEGIAQTNVNLLSLINALKIETDAGSTSSALSSSITLLTLINVIATALENEGDIAGASEVETLEASLLNIPDMNESIQLGDLLVLSGTEDSLLDLDINAFHLFTGALQLFNSSNTLDTPTPLSINNATILSSLGLSTIASNVNLSLRITEPPQYRCGPSGTTVSSAFTRLKLDLTLLSGFNSSNTTLGSTLSVSLTELAVYLELASAEATLSYISASSPSSGSVSLSATHGVARVFIGSFNDATFFSPGYSPPSGSSVLNDLGFAQLGQLTLLANTATVSARSYAEGTQNSNNLTFNSFASTQTVNSSAGVIGTLISDAVSNLEINVDTSGLLSVLSLLGATTNSLLNATKPLVSQLLEDQLLNPILTVAIDGLLSFMGVSIGKVVIFVNGFAGACTVSGYVYQDNNPNNNQRDAEENWNSGTSVWLTVTEDDNVVRSIQIHPGDGAFSIDLLPLGTYLFLISNEAGSTTASAPQGWTPTAPESMSIQVSLLTTSTSELTFGFASQSVDVSGLVFWDDGNMSGTANDGLQNGDETFFNGATLYLRDASTGDLILSTTSDNNGEFSFQVEPEWQNQNLALLLQPSDNIITIAIEAGTSGGTFSNPAITFNLSSTSVTGISIAAVKSSRLSADVEAVTGPGQTVLFNHTFTPGSTGQLILSLTQTSQNNDWQAANYLNSDCDREIDAEDLHVSSAIDVSGLQTLCILTKIHVPASSKHGAQSHWRFNVEYQLNDDITEQLSNQNLIFVSSQYEGALMLLKSVDKSSAIPGDALSYTLTYSNTGTNNISNIIIYDQTPPFTKFISSDCASSLGAAFDACSANTPQAGQSGELQWEMSGELMPGATGSIQYRVIIED